MKQLFSALAGLCDVLVAPSFGAPGYHLRSKTWHPKALDVDLTGEVHLVTGANSGLGRVTAEALAGLGATVHMVCRNLERGEAAKAEILAKMPSAKLVLEHVDISEMSQIWTFLQDFKKRVTRLDALIHNAGVLLNQREETCEGLEVSFATNVLAPFVLTRELAELLESSRPSRVVFVSSGGMYTQRLEVGDMQFARRDFDGVVAYAQHKRAQILLTEYFAEQFRRKGIKVNAMHPGWADTPGVKKSLPGFRKLTRSFLRDSEQGADTIIWLAVSPECADVTGEFFFDRMVRRKHAPFASTQASPEERARLIAECSYLTAPPKEVVEAALTADEAETEAHHTGAIDV